MSLSPSCRRRVGWSLLAALAGATAESGAAPSLATVNADVVAVYAGMSKASPVVTSFRRGHQVAVDFSVAGAGEMWCSVSEVGQAAPAGYVPCTHLVPAPPAPAAPAERPAPSPPVASQPPERERGAGSRDYLDWLSKNRPEDWDALQIGMNKYNAAFWAVRLQFSPAQVEAVRGLAERTGVTGCRQWLAAFYRRFGLDSPSGPDAAENFTQAMRELRHAARGMRCQVVEFWTQFPRVMTPAQRAEFERWQRQPDVPFLTRAPLDPTLRWFDD